MKYIHDFTSKICSKTPQPLLSEGDKKGHEQALPCVYADRYQVLPNHMTVIAASITQDRD